MSASSALDDLSGLAEDEETADDLRRLLEEDGPVAYLTFVDELLSSRRGGDGELIVGPWPGSSEEASFGRLFVGQPFVRPTASQARNLPIVDRVRIVWADEPKLALPTRGERFEPRPYTWTEDAS